MTAPHDARLLVAGAKLLEIDSDIDKMEDSLQEDYPDTSSKLSAIRFLIGEVLQDLRQISHDDEEND